MAEDRSSILPMPLPSSEKNSLKSLTLLFALKKVSCP